MTSTVTGAAPEVPSTVCRLCLNDGSPLVNVFAEEYLHRWISDFLSITISTGDRMSQEICAVCRNYLTEFEGFWRSCHEAQGILQSLSEDANDEAATGIKCENLDNVAEVHRKIGSNSDVPFNIKAEPCEEDDFVTGDEELFEPKTETVSFTDDHTFEQDAEADQPILMDDDMIETQDVKIEAHSDDGSASEENLLEEYQSSSLSTVNEKKESGRKRIFQCDKCQKKYPRKSYLHKHDMFVHNPKSHKCHPCELAFASKIKLIIHESSQKHLKTIRTLKLTNNYKDNALDVHRIPNNEASKKAHPKEEFITGFVPDTNGKSSNYNLSQAKVATDGNPQWECEICNKSYASCISLYHHMRVHFEPKHFCPICERPFRKRVDMKRHIQTHEVKPRRKCVPKRYDADEDRPFKCDICQKAFRQRSTLYNHKIKVHGPEIFTCLICDMKFRTRFNMERHVRRHNR